MIMEKVERQPLTYDRYGDNEEKPAKLLLVRMKKKKKFKHFRMLSKLKMF